MEKRSAEKIDVKKVAEDEIKKADLDKTKSASLRKQVKQENDIAALLQEKGTVSIEEMSNTIELDKQLIYKLLNSLKKRRPELRIACVGESIMLQTRSGETLEPTDIEVKNGNKLFRDTITLGVLATVNLGSTAQQMDTLKHVFKNVLGEYGIDTVFVNGNFVMSPALRYKKNETFLMKIKTPIQEMRAVYAKRGSASKTKLEKMASLFMRLVPYVAKHFPRQANGRLIKSHIIGGLNEAEWAKFGFDVITHIVKRRMEVLNVGPEKNDLSYKGDFFRIFRIKNAGEIVPIVLLNSKHKPMRGIYSRSHRPQRTSVTVASWFMEKLKRAGFEGMPYLVIWTDGRGIFTYKATGAGSHFVSLPSLSIGDPADFDVDTTPNFGMVIITLCFDDKGHLKQNSMRVRLVDLANYVTQRGW